MYSKEKIQEIMSDIKSYGLNAPEDMLKASDDELIAVCNGAGGDEMPTGLREILSIVMRFAECSVAIHDWQYSKSDGKRETRAIVDKNFRANMLDEILQNRSKRIWWNEWKALRAYLAVKEFGYADWCIAYTKSQTREK